MAVFLAVLIRVLSGCTVRRFPELPKGKPIVFFSNHTSNLDFPVIWASLPREVRAITRPIAAKDYWTKNKLRRYLASKVFHAILIERRAVTRENNPMQEMKQVLSEGSNLIIFPEGTRSRTGEVGEFKSGLYHLARSTNETVFIPVLLNNLFRILPKGELFPLPLIATLIYGDPLYLDAGEHKDAFLQKAKSALLAQDDVEDSIHVSQRKVSSP